MTRRPIRIAVFGGGISDKFSALEEAVLGEPVDVVIGDAMAELSQSLISAEFRSRPEAQRQFYSAQFVAQLRPLLDEISQRGIKVVSNAGVYNSAGLAAIIKVDIAERSLGLKVAYVEGDDLLDRAGNLLADGQLSNLITGAPLKVASEDIIAAKAYLGGWGIKTALDEGADIVVTGRVADASVVTGPAAWWHGWERDEYDALAGALAAGHIIECGPWNYSAFAKDVVEPGFPIAEIEADGSFVITKRAAEEGQMNTLFVTAQLMYEIQGTRYLKPRCHPPYRFPPIDTRGSGPRARLRRARQCAAGDHQGGDQLPLRFPRRDVAVPHRLRHGGEARGDPGTRRAGCEGIRDRRSGGGALRPSGPRPVDSTGGYTSRADRCRCEE